MSAGRTEGVETDDIRRLPIPDLELANQSSRAHLFELPIKDQTSVINAMKVDLTPPQIMVDLIPRFTYPARKPEQPNPKRPKPEDRPKYLSIGQFRRKRHMSKWRFTKLAIRWPENLPADLGTAKKQV